METKCRLFSQLFRVLIKYYDFVTILESNGTLYFVFIHLFSKYFSFKTRFLNTFLPLNMPLDLSHFKLFIHTAGSLASWLG